MKQASSGATSGPRLLIYAEDALLADGQSGIGLSKALVPTVSAIADAVDTIVLNQTHDFHPRTTLQPFAGTPYLVARRWQHMLARAIQKLPMPLSWTAAMCHGVLLGLWVLPSTRARSKGTLRLWSAVGVDVLTLIRVRTLARVLGIPFEVYLVDDIEKHPHNQRWAASLRARITGVLQAAQRVHVITPELGARLRERHGVQTQVLPLSVLPPSIEDSSERTRHSEYFAAYLGSINHLYAAGLQQLVSVVERLRKQHDRDLKVRLFAPVTQLRQLFGEQVPPWIVGGRAEADSELRADLSRSTFAFLPYSFDASARDMTSTSFPSKLLDYLTCARAIVVYAPDDSVPAKYFAAEHLPYVVTAPVELERVLGTLVLHPVDHSDRYRGLLSRRHSRASVRELLLGECHDPQERPGMTSAVKGQ